MGKRLVGSPPFPRGSLGRTQLLFGLRGQAEQELDRTGTSLEGWGPGKAALPYGSFFGHGTGLLLPVPAGVRRR